ncbi:hypothetical protein SCB17_002866 [Clostridium perfringens]|uniref:hypothetical protein n=1 Tax=Clostridium perfringens TaxID=1502 RepID=UPI00290DD9DA|nr:hypothetical protein [Clostridium perfringens]MDU3845683.1 hypothetical protein [Clostridium perfringens]
MKKYLNIISNNLRSIFSIKNLIFIIVIFIYVFSVKINNYDSNFSFNEILEVIFAGPINLDNISEIFTWTFYQAFLIYIIGNYIFNELSTRSIYVIPRLGNKQYWNICLQITCFLACIIYFALGTFIEFIFTAILNKGFNFSNIIDTLQIVVLLSLSSYYAITVYIFNIMVTKSHIKSFLILIVEFYVSISIGDIFNIDKFIPLNQGILSKHIIYNFSYNWSFIFLGILIFINLVIINRLIVKRDLLDITY